MWDNNSGNMEFVHDLNLTEVVELKQGQYELWLLINQVTITHPLPPAKKYILVLL